MASKELYTCSECKKTFNALGRFNQHVKLHVKPWACERCNRGFGLRADLNRHVRARHCVGNARFECPVLQCPFKATRRDNVSQHVKKIHGISSKGLIQKKQLAVGRQGELINNGDSAEASPVYTWLSLMEAATTGDLVALKKVLSSGVDIDSQADDGRTALHCAARAGQEEVARVILELDTPRWNQKSYSFWCSVLQESIIGKSLGCCQLLIGSPVIKDSMTRMMSGLVDIFSDPWYKPQLKGNEAWAHMANLATLVTRSNDRGIAVCILQSFAVEPVGTQRVESIVMRIKESLARLMAVDAAKKGLICILQMLEVCYPAALHGSLMAQEYPLRAATAHNQAACVRWLLRHTRELNYRKASVFQKAAKLGFKTIVEIFLERESDFCPNVRHRSGRTALHDAVKSGDAEIVQLLIESASTDVNIKTKSYQRERDTALHLAVGMRNLAIVKILLRCTRTDVSLEDSEGRTALYLAASHGFIEIATALLEHGARDDRALFQAFSNWETSMSVVQLTMRYMERDFDATFKESSILTRAHLGEFLFKMKGYRYRDVYISERWGRMYLIPIAVKERDIDLLRLLLGLDSITADDLNEKMRNPRFWYCYHTPLNYARSRGFTDIADLLSARGAVDQFDDPHGYIAAEEKRDALRLAAKDDGSTNIVEEQPLPSEASREIPEIALREEFDSDPELEGEPDSYVDEYVDPRSIWAEK